MKKAMLSITALSILLVGCGEPKYLGENSQRKFYPTYGIINESSSRSKHACYEISIGTIVWSVILVETLVAPAYFIGWSLYNPVRLKHGQDDECTFDD